MPRFNKIKKDIAQRAQKIAEDVKSTLDKPADKAWNESVDIIKKAGADTRTEARKTIEHNINKEYKKEVSEAKAKLIEARNDFKQSIADELGYTKDTLHDEIIAFDAELEKELVAPIEDMLDA